MKFDDEIKLNKKMKHSQFLLFTC